MNQFQPTFEQIAASSAPLEVSPRQKWEVADELCRAGPGGMLTYHAEAFDEGIAAAQPDLIALLADRDTPPDNRNEVIDHDIRGNPITRGDVAAFVPQAPDAPVADCGPNPVTWSEADKHRLDVALNKMYGTPLPAAPAPTRATDEQESEINAAVKAGRITFEPGWDDPRTGAAPTEQPSHETIVREGNMLTCTACGTSKKMADPCAAPTE